MEYYYYMIAYISKFGIFCKLLQIYAMRNMIYVWTDHRLCKFQWESKPWKCKTKWFYGETLNWAANSEELERQIAYKIGLRHAHSLPICMHMCCGKYHHSIERNLIVILNVFPSIVKEHDIYAFVFLEIMGTRRISFYVGSTSPTQKRIQKWQRRIIVYLVKSTV